MIKYSDIDVSKISDSDYILLDDSIYDSFDKFIKICHSNRLVSFMTSDFEIIRFINNTIHDHIYNPISLIDDGEIKDRSYIKREDYYKLDRFGIPLSYVMWNPEFDRYLYTHIASKNDGEPCDLPYVDRVFWKEYLRKIRDDLDKLEDLGELGNIYEVSKYIQDVIQYVGDNIVRIGDYDYVLSDSTSHKVVIDASKIGTLLDDRYGTCTGISAYTMLLLNNPKLKVNCRVLYNNSHAWNFIYYGGSLYLSDNALNIISGDIGDNLMSKSFNSKYVLFGQDRELPIHRVFDNNLVSSEDINDYSIDVPIYHGYSLRKGHFKVLKTKHKEDRYDS